MKRIGYIYEDIVSVENCKQAILDASKKKKKRKSVSIILSDLDNYALLLSEKLKNLDFTSPYTKKMIKDGLSGKVRELQIPKFFPDQCSHHAIVRVLKPIILKSSYYWSCANIPNRGIDHAAKGVERATKRDIKHCKYCVKLDISKFYPSISHEVLKAKLQEKIKDKKALKLLYTVIDSHDEGLPIGNYTSPWFAEFLLQPNDHMVKEKYNIRHYIRYDDYMVLIDNNKRKLRRALKGIMENLSSISLKLKGNYQLFKIQKKSNDNHKIGRKIDFVGRCFGLGFTTIRKRRALALMRQSRLIQKLQKAHKKIPYKVASGFISRCNAFKHTDSFKMKEKYYNPINIKELKETIRYESKRKSITSTGIC